MAETTETMRGTPSSKEKTGAPEAPKFTSQDMTSTPLRFSSTWHIS